MNVQYSGRTYTIHHDSKGIEIEEVKIDPDFTSLLIFVRIVSISDGYLEITLPRDLIDAKLNHNDDEFIILIDGEETRFTEVESTSHKRTLRIEVPHDAEEIEIIGTQVANQDIEILPEIMFNKEVYDTRDDMIVSIISPMSNKDPLAKEIIRAKIFSHDLIAGFYDFEETGSNTGIFERKFTLSPDINLYKGDLMVVSGQTIGVEFAIKQGLVAYKTIMVKSEGIPVKVTVSRARRGLDTIVPILELIQEDVTSAREMAYKVKIDSRTVSKYLIMLLKLNLVKVTKEGEYRITNKGRQFLEKYEQLRKFETLDDSS